MKPSQNFEEITRNKIYEEKKKYLKCNLIPRWSLAFSFTHKATQAITNSRKFFHQNSVSNTN